MPRIKGWKKDKRGGTRRVLYWNEAKGKFLGIEVVYYVIPAHGNRRGEGWRVRFGNTHLKYTKTKKRAMAYAVNWMRKHPDG